jgi:hypothetical protein
MSEFLIAHSVFVALLTVAAQGPTPDQLGQALQAFSPNEYKNPPVVRRVSCKVLGDPTEFSCLYEQREKATQWAKLSVYVAIDGGRWVVIDSPGPREKAR